MTFTSDLYWNKIRNQTVKNCRKMKKYSKKQGFTGNWKILSMKFKRENYLHFSENFILSARATFIGCIFFIIIYISAICFLCQETSLTVQIEPLANRKLIADEFCNHILIFLAQG